MSPHISVVDSSQLAQLASQTMFAAVVDHFEAWGLVPARPGKHGRGITRFVSSLAQAMSRLPARACRQVRTGDTHFYTWLMSVAASNNSPLSVETRNSYEHPARCKIADAV